MKTIQNSAPRTARPWTKIIALSLAVTMLTSALPYDAFIASENEDEQYATALLISDEVSSELSEEANETPSPKLRELVQGAVTPMTFAAFSEDISSYEEIETAEDFDKIRSNLSGSYKLANDISLENYSSWAPIGDEEHPFLGKFDGNGFKITDLKISEDVTTSKALLAYGLFGFTRDAIINGVTLENVDINVKATASGMSSNVEVSLDVGGVAGYSQLTTISNCRISGVINGEIIGMDNQYARVQVGGIVGEITYTSPLSTISGCANFASVSSTSNSYAYAGGIAGANGCAITKSYNEGEILGVSSSIDSCLTIGGIAGISVDNSDCYNMGAVRIDYSEPSYHYYVSGISTNGYNFDAEIYRCYNIGDIDIDAGVNSAAIFQIVKGSPWDENVVDCYYLGTAGTNDENASPLTQTQMKIKESYNGFDFDNDWIIFGDLNDGYPMLGAWSKWISFEDDPWKIEDAQGERKIYINNSDNHDDNSYNFRAINDENATFKGVIFRINGDWVDNYGKPVDFPFISLDGELNVIPEDYYVKDGGDDQQITITAYPADYIYTENESISAEIEVRLSNEPPYQITPLPKEMVGVVGKDVRIAFKNPRHIDVVNELAENGNGGYTIEVLDENGDVVLGKDGKPIEYTKIAKEAFVIKMDKSNNEYDASEIVDLKPGNYKVKISFTCVEDKDKTTGARTPKEGFVELTIKPASPKVGLPASKNTIYQYTNNGDNPVIYYNVSGYGTLNETITVYRNNEFVIESPPDAPSDKVTPYKQYKVEDIGASMAGLIDIYKIEITAKDDYGGSATATYTFEVYNADALKREFQYEITGIDEIPETLETIEIDNSSKVAGKSSAELWDLRSNVDNELTNEYKFQLHNSKNSLFNWTNRDVMSWTVVDENVAQIYYLAPKGWTLLPNGETLSPDVQVRIIGVDEGKTNLIVKHEKTGINAEIPIEIKTLENELYYISISPEPSAGATYVVMVNGSPLEYDNTGRIAFYLPEEGGLKSLTVQSNGGEDAFYAKIDVSKLVSGEKFLSFYPVNQQRLVKMSNVSFDIYEPDGSRYYGQVLIRGGLFVNEKERDEAQIDDSSIIQDDKGRFNVKLALANLGNIGANEELKCVFELRFPDTDYAPQLVEVDVKRDSLERLKNGEAVVFLQARDEGKPIIISQLLSNGRDITKLKETGITDDEPNVTLKAYAIAPSNISVDSVKIKELNDAVNAIRDSEKDKSILKECKYKFLSNKQDVSDYQYFEIVWQPKSGDFSKDTLGEVKTYNVEFSGSKNDEDKVYTWLLKEVVSVSNTLGLTAEANAKKSLVIDVDPSGINVIAEARNFNGYTLPGFKLNLNGLTFDTNVKQDKNNPYVFEFKGYYSARYSATTTDVAFERNYNDVRDRVERLRSNSSSVAVEASFLKYYSAGLEASLTGLEAYVEGRLTWNIDKQTFELSFDRGYAIGQASGAVSFGVGLPTPVLVANITISAGAYTNARMVVNPNELILVVDTGLKETLSLNGGISYVIGKTQLVGYGSYMFNWKMVSTYGAQSRKTQPGFNASIDGQLGLKIEQWAGFIVMFRAHTWDLFTKKYKLVDLGSSGYIPVGALNAKGFSLEPFAEEISDDDVYFDADYDPTVTAEKNGMKVSTKTVLNDTADLERLNAMIEEKFVNWDELYSFLGKSEIAVQIGNGEWKTITDDLYANVEPRVSTNGNKAVVVWQKQTFYSNGEIAEGIPNMGAITELWYSVYDGSEWSEEKRLDVYGENMITDYSVLMNEFGFAVTTNAYDAEENVSFVTFYYVDFNGKVTINNIANKTESSVNAQMVLANDGFYLTYYRSGYESDIMAVKASSRGAISASPSSVKAISGISAFEPNVNYLLIGDDNGENACLLSSSFDFQTDGDAIYALLLTSAENELRFSAPLLVVAPAENNLLDPISGILKGEKLALDYEKYEIIDAETYDLKSIPTSPVVAEFVNSFLYGAQYSDLEIAPNVDVMMDVRVVNVGVVPITTLNVEVAGDVTSANCYILPGEALSISVVVKIGENIENSSYKITAFYENGDSKTSKTETLYFRKPNVSFGNAVVTRAENGERDIMFRLYNDSDVPIHENGNVVKVSIYNDVMRENKIGEILINDPTDLQNLDDGGLNVFYTYHVGAGDLTGDEIREGGVWLYMLVEILNNAQRLEQKSYLENQTAVGVFRLMPASEERVLISAETTIDEFGTLAKLNVSNLTMKPIETGKIILNLHDENGAVLESNSVYLAKSIPEEDDISQLVQFSKEGSSVSATFEAVNDVVPVYGISIAPSGEATLTKTKGYLNAVQAVTINNAGNQPTGALEISLTGNDVPKFVLSETEISNVGVGQIATFTVSPIAGLPAGSYSTQVVIAGENGINESLLFTFIVNEETAPPTPPTSPEQPPTSPEQPPEQPPGQPSEKPPAGSPSGSGSSNNNKPNVFDPNLIVLDDTTGTIISKEYLQKIKKDGVLVHFKLPNGFVVMIDPDKITDEAITTDVDLKISIITKDTVQKDGVTVFANSIIITPSAHGKFGFETSFGITSSQLNEAKLKANDAKLFYVSDNKAISKDGKVVKINNDVMLSINHASYYVLSAKSPAVIPIIEPSGKGNGAPSNENGDGVSSNNGDDNIKTGVVIWFAPTIIAAAIIIITIKPRGARKLKK